MTHIAIAGAGHVGLVHAAGLARAGHMVSVVDVVEARVTQLREGRVWFFEPGLTEALAEGASQGRIVYTTSYAEALRGAQFVFVCVPTPATSDGSLDDSMLSSSLRSIRSAAGTPAPIVVVKSTVPVGTSARAETLFAEIGARVVASPEFLAEGRALADFSRPSRIVVGSSERTAAEAVGALFAFTNAPVVFTDTRSAEFAKLASNAFLAMRVSYANALGQLAERVGADTDQLLAVLASDPRIGASHLRVGLGFGGACLPKDLGAVEALARHHHVPPDIFASVRSVNRDQPERVVAFLTDRLGSLAGRRIALLGLTHKGGTDTVSESPAVALAHRLLALGATLAAYDPAAHPELGTERSTVTFAPTALDGAAGADAVVIGADWPELARLDLAALKGAMRGDILVDGRGVVNASDARRHGFVYFGFGRGGGSARTDAVPVG